MNEKVVTKFLEILSSRSQSYGIVVPWTKSVKKTSKTSKKRQKNVKKSKKSKKAKKAKKVQPVCKKWAALTIYIM